MRRFLRFLLGRRGRGSEHVNRGLARFDEVLRAAGSPTLTELVSRGGGGGRAPRVLEIGCGEGRLLLDLRARFGEGVELHGVNHPRWPVAADARALLATNARHRILTRRRLEREGLPTIHLADAQELGGFPARGFDLVVSQVVVPHVARKDRVLEESARLLAPGGAFLHEMDHLDGREPELLRGDLPRFRVLDGDAYVSATAHLERRDVRVSRCVVRDRTVLLATFRRGDAPLDLGLRLDEGATVLLKGRAGLDPAHAWGILSAFRAGTAARAAP